MGGASKRPLARAFPLGQLGLQEPRLGAGCPVPVTTHLCRVGWGWGWGWGL